MDVFFDDLVLNGEPIDLGTDPKWDAKGNRVEFQDRVRRPLHDFGFSPTRHAGGKAAGEIGGLVCATRPLPITPTRSARSASTTPSPPRARWLSPAPAATAGSTSAGSIPRRNEPPALPKRTAHKNFLAVLIEGPSRIGHYFRPCYRRSDGEGATPDDGPVIRPDGQVHDWSLRYDPAAAGGIGVITVAFDGKQQSLPLRPGDKVRGATFDRFGLFNYQTGGNYVIVYFDDLSYTSRR